MPEAVQLHPPPCPTIKYPIRLRPSLLLLLPLLLLGLGCAAILRADGSQPPALAQWEEDMITYG